MSEDAYKLLMMFINDSYSSSGKISKNTAVALMSYVASEPVLQKLVNNGDSKAILEYKFCRRR